MDNKKDRLITKLRNELGGHILEALVDQSVIEIMLNPDGQVWIDRLGEGMQPLTHLTPVNAESLIGTVADSLNTTITRESPILEGELPINGERFEALIPPVVTAPTFTIRKKAIRVFTLDDYKAQQSITNTQYQVLSHAVKERKNILVVGGTGSGKTTLSNAIIHSIQTQHPNDRLVIIEDTAELQCSADNNVTLRTSMDVDMLGLLRATMRLRPDRIIVGEVRGGEALALLKAWNTGHSGGIATVHANNAQAGLVRLEQLAYEATNNAKTIPPLIAEAVHYVVFIRKEKDQRIVKEILQVHGYEHNQYLTTSL